MSKTSNLTKNTSRDASYHEFTPEADSIIVGNSQPVGSLSIEQLAKGVRYPNTQDAIGDAAAIGVLPINAVYICTDGVSPAGIHQVDRYVFTGTVNDPNKGLQEEMQIVLYGVPVTIKNGDTAEQVAIKAKLEFEILQAQGLVFNFVNTGPTNNVLEVGYLDYKKHVLPTYTVNNLTVTQQVVSPSRPGYGLWQRLGATNLTFEGETAPVTFTYFQRYN